MATANSLKQTIEKLTNAIGSKFITAPLKEKMEKQLKEAKDELEKLQSATKTAVTGRKRGRPKGAGVVKAASKTLQSFSKLIKSKGYEDYKGAGIDLKKDAALPALAKGKRTSKSGKTYYEYRANRYDVKQPKRKQKYPILKMGGYMAKGGSVNSRYNYGRAWTLDHNQHNKREDYEKPMSERKGFLGLNFARGGNTGNYNTGRSWTLDHNQHNKRESYEIPMENRKMANGGYNPDSEETKMMVASAIHTNPQIKEHFEMGTSADEEEQKVIRGFFDDEPYEYGKGGYMAKGGMIAHGLRVGDKIVKTIRNKYSTEKALLIENKGKEYIVIIETGIRMKNKYGKDYAKNFETLAKGGKLSSRYNYGRAWTLDHNQHNKREDYEKPMSERKGFLGLNFARGGNTGNYNTGRSWTLDHNQHNKRESYEIPIENRKMATGGKVSYQNLSEMKSDVIN